MLLYHETKYLENISCDTVIIFSMMCEVSLRFTISSIINEIESTIFLRNINWNNWRCSTLKIRQISMLHNIYFSASYHSLFLCFQTIMKDKWMNMGYDDEELKPYLEPEPDYKDHKRIGESASMYITLTIYCFFI